MPTEGINYEKCNNCGICTSACPIPGYFYSRNEEDQYPDVIYYRVPPRFKKNVKFH